VSNFPIRLEVRQQIRATDNAMHNTAADMRNTTARTRILIDATLAQIRELDRLLAWKLRES